MGITYIFIYIPCLFCDVIRWWSGSKCDDFKDTKTSGTKELDLPNIGGVFIVLAVGVAVAVVVCVLEVIYKKAKKRRSKVLAVIVLRSS